MQCMKPLGTMLSEATVLLHWLSTIWTSIPVRKTYRAVRRIRPFISLHSSAIRTLLPTIIMWMHCCWLKAASRPIRVPTIALAIPTWVCNSIITMPVSITPISAWQRFIPPNCVFPKRVSSKMPIGSITWNWWQAIVCSIRIWISVITTCMLPSLHRQVRGGDGAR